MAETLAMAVVVLTAILLFSLQYWALVWFAPSEDDE